MAKKMTEKQKTFVKGLLAFFAAIASAFAGAKLAPVVEGSKQLGEAIVDAVPAEKAPAPEAAPEEPKDTDPLAK